MYKYTIIQENKDDKTKLSYEFSACDEHEFVDNITSFMHSAGWILDGSLGIDYDEFDDLDSEVLELSDEYVNPDIESYKNFEFPIGSGQMDYSYDSSDMNNIYENSQQTFDFPLDRPSQPTYRIDSLYSDNTANTSIYYGV